MGSSCPLSPTAWQVRASLKKVSTPHSQNFEMYPFSSEFVRTAFFLIFSLSGSAAGLTAVIMTYPLDVVRARLALHVEDKPSTSPSSGGNSSNSRNSPIRGIRGMLLHTYQSEGVRGLYRGIGPTLIGIVPYSGIKFFVYQGMKRLYVRLYEERRDSRGGEGNSLQVCKKTFFFPVASFTIESYALFCTSLVYMPYVRYNKKP